MVEYLRVFRHVGFFLFLVDSRSSQPLARKNCHEHRLLEPSGRIAASPAGERLLTVDELARHLRVSTKTVRRWRRYGLVSRRFVLAGRRRVGFLQSSVDHFLAHNAERVRRGTRFSRLTDEERQQIIDRARCLAQAGECPTEITSRIAQETGRSVETIRYTLKYFDMEHPDLAIFPHSHHPLRIETKTEIFQQYRRGDSVEALAQRFGQTWHRIYRIINDMMRRTDHGVAAGLHRQRAVRPPAFGEEGTRDLAAAAGKRSADEEAAGAQRLAPVSGRPVRGAPADARAGGPSLSEDELPQVQGEQASRHTRCEPAQRVA